MGLNHRYASKPKMVQKGAYGQVSARALHHHHRSAFSIRLKRSCSDTKHRSGLDWWHDTVSPSKVCLVMVAQFLHSPVHQLADTEVRPFFEISSMASRFDGPRAIVFDARRGPWPGCRAETRAAMRSTQRWSSSACRSRTHHQTF